MAGPELNLDGFDPTRHGVSLNVVLSEIDCLERNSPDVPYPDRYERNVLSACRPDRAEKTGLIRRFGTIGATR